MSWVKIDDVAPEHPKLLAAGAGAVCLWLCALAYCNRQKAKDGFVPEAKVELLYPGIGRAEAERLCDVGLFEHIDGGYLIHDYGVYQGGGHDPDLSSKRSAAGRAGGKQSGEARRSKARSKPGSKPEPSLKANKEANSEHPTEASLARTQTRAGPFPARPDQTQSAAAADPKDLTGFPREEPESPAAAAAAAIERGDLASFDPKNFADAMVAPVCVRAEFAQRIAQRDELRRDWLEPQRWPEFQRVNAALAEATGSKPLPLGPPSRDAGTRALLVLFAAGFMPGDLVRAARRLPSEPGWAAEGRRRGLSWMTPEVVRRTLSAAPPEQPVDPDVQRAIEAARGKNGSDG